MGDKLYDIAVIGGGVNGCGIARDAAGRGLSVLLAEKQDISCGTSSASTKLIHGGLRYLEHYEFRLVRESLQEREVLLAMAPHIISPLRFVLPHHAALRPAWLVRLGLFIYDHLGKRKRLPSSRSVNLKQDEAGQPLKPGFTRGFEYSDCRVNDARLVVLNAMDAAARGADIRVRTEVRSATREDGVWRVQLEDKHTGKQETIAARTLVNASGPWIADVISSRLGMKSRLHTRLVKGSHIVVPRMFTHNRAYIFQNADKRIIFAIPFEEAFTLIGTTDVDYEGDPNLVGISNDEVTYLCNAVNEYFVASVKPEDVKWSYSGLRPLYGDDETSAQEATRDYMLDLQGSEDEAPLLNIFGGKITTYRCLAEEALQLLKKGLPNMKGPWTRDSFLPGGDIGPDGLDALAKELVAEYPVIEAPMAARLARSYGVLAHDILKGVKQPADLGEHFGADLYEREVVYLLRSEWARDAEDILWRRSKLGLLMTEKEAGHLAEWVKQKLPVVMSAVA